MDIKLAIANQLLLKNFLYSSTSGKKQLNNEDEIPKNKPRKPRPIPDKKCVMSNAKHIPNIRNRDKKCRTAWIRGGFGTNKTNIDTEKKLKAFYFKCN